MILCGVLAPVAGAVSSYRVEPGDTLTAIAARVHTSVTRLEALNGLSANSTLLAGVLLRLPPPPSLDVRYEVLPGDTLTGIAARYATDASAIARANGIGVGEVIIAGTTLRVPVRGDASPLTPSRVPRYRVRSGDTLSGIALRYGISLNSLLALNGLAASAPLLAGATLLLPAGSGTVAASATPTGTVTPVEPEGATASAQPSPTMTATQLPATAQSVRSSLLYWSEHYGVDPHLATAVAWMESGFNNNAVSTVGAVGVMQITPATWSYVQQVLLLGEPVPNTADGNVRIGVALLHHLLHIYDGNVEKALAAYYQGVHSLQVDGPLPGTGHYVASVLALAARV
jgi:LysM repeat protein